MAKLFLDHGAEINAEGGDYRGPNGPGDDPSQPRPTPLDKAVEAREREMARFLLSRGAQLVREKPEELHKLMESAADAQSQK